MTDHLKPLNTYQLPIDDESLQEECRVETFRAGGPGGQHQNKTDSAVRLTHLLTGICVTARDFRSQHQNRRLALIRMRAAIKEAFREDPPRVPTKTPAREKRKRIEEKRRRAATKRLRRIKDPKE